MPHSASAIWLLVADEEKANIYESREGCSQLLRSIGNTAMPPASLWAEGGADAANVIPLQGRGAVPSNERDRNRDFAFQLTVALLDGAEANVCDGIIVVATRDMMDALRRVRPLAISRLLVAEVLELAPGALAKSIPPQPAANANSSIVVKLPLTGSSDRAARPTDRCARGAFNPVTAAEGCRERAHSA